VAERLGRALERDPAGLEDVRPVGDVERLVDVLLDEQDRPIASICCSPPDSVPPA
jgi:hypothetical protein